MYHKAILLYVLGIIVILLVLIWTTRKILKPVDVISQSITRVKSGDMQEKIAIEGTNEIWQLAQEYNEMLHSIRKANRKVEEQHGQMIESMKMKQRAEREALESQINAHFICNTLNAINYEAIDSGNYKVSVLLKKLSNILRYTFDQKHQNVYMFQEISWIEQYLFLQKERMGTVFDYEIDFDSDYDNWPCRKLMLQPFVENSILHGFEGRKNGGYIHISGKGYQEYLKIVIEDNGCGMNRERSNIINEIIQNPMLAKEKEVGIGISNVVTRMRMYYGDKIKIQLETEEGKGTRFIFILPEPEKV
jgi:two-component system sensor histidine kinase YesM